MEELKRVMSFLQPRVHLLSLQIPLYKLGMVVEAQDQVIRILPKLFGYSKQMIKVVKLMVRVKGRLIYLVKIKVHVSSKQLH